MVRKSKIMRVSSVFDEALEDYMRNLKKNYGVSLNSKIQTTEVIGNLIKKRSMIPSRITRKKKSKKFIMEFDL